MNWKWIYVSAVAYGLYEGLATNTWKPLLLFLCCGLTYLAVKDSD